jgi:hypothetical protein
MCAACGAREAEDGRSVGSAVLGLVSVGYLATLALGYEIWKARPFVGGLAAIVAIGLGRILQTAMRIPTVTSRAARVDESGRAR